MGVTEVTNGEFRRFRPSHGQFRNQPEDGFRGHSEAMWGTVTFNRW